ncbi:MAG: hypothetical protein ACRDF9_11435 [Candidatus Limnocylindria bacterium]
MTTAGAVAAAWIENRYFDESTASTTVVAADPHSHDLAKEARDRLNTVMAHIGEHAPLVASFQRIYRRTVVARRKPDRLYAQKQWEKARVAYEGIVEDIKRDCDSDPRCRDLQIPITPDGS